MGTSKISNIHKENLSIAEIQKLCAIAGNIEANIQSNDKTPSWDGELFLYEKNKIILVHNPSRTTYHLRYVECRQTVSK